MRRWLQEAGQSESSVTRRRDSIEQLTLDLNSGAAVRKVSPTLHQIISSRHDGDSLLDQSRRKWLERLDASVLISDIVALWKKAAPHFVPDPAESRQSGYDQHAEWLKVLYELNRREYDKVIRQWSGCPSAPKKPLESGFRARAAYSGQEVRPPKGCMTIRGSSSNRPPTKVAMSCAKADNALQTKRPLGRGNQSASSACYVIVPHSCHKSPA